jgi:hypothetical protein
MTRMRPPASAPDGAPGPNVVRLWEVRTGQKRLVFTLPFTLRLLGKARTSEPRTFAVSPDGRFLATDRAEVSALSVWDLATGEEVARRGGYGALVHVMAFSPDGKALASGHADGTALVWDVSALPAVKAAATDRDAAWTDLRSADAAKAYRAMLALAADPAGVKFLRDRVKPAPEVPAARLQKLVADLDGDKYATREAATAALKKLGDAADGQLQALLRGKLSAEQYRRITDVLASREMTESDPDRLRDLRTVEVLERVGSAEADAVLAELAKGAAGARLTREAAGAAWRRGVPSR